MFLDLAVISDCLKWNCPFSTFCLSARPPCSHHTVSALWEREQCCAHSRCLIKTWTITSIVLFYFFLPDTFPRESVWSRVAKQNETMGFRIWRPISYPSSSHFLPKSQLPRLFFLWQLNYCPSSPPLVDSISWISLGSAYFSKPCGHFLS